MSEGGELIYEQKTTSYRGFSEDELIEQPAIDLFKVLGWQTANLYGEFGTPATPRPSPEGRESRRDAFLPNRLRTALSALNPGLQQSALDEAYALLTSERTALEPARANADLYGMLRDGVKVKVRSPDGSLRDEAVRAINWENAGANDFLLANQVWFSGDLYTRRADLVGFVNGIPLLFIELKALYHSIADAYDGNLKDYRTAIPQVFVPNAFVILSNGHEAKLGASLAPFEFFADWKKIDEEEEEGVVSLETLIRGTCRPQRFLDIVENFIAFQEGDKGLIKILAKNHQYLGVNRAMEAVGRLKENQGRLGVFWHTQGSGKSFSMMFFSRKVMRKRPGDWTFVIVTDRTELDDQIADTFSSCGVLTKDRQLVQAGSRRHLQELLTGNERYIFSLIQKFGTERGEVYPILSTRSDVIVITDEAHRSQYDVLAANMRAALPNAAFLGFTGTPLIAEEAHRTRTVFGHYVSIYDFAQSIADGATVPLYYESRLPELQLKSADLDEEIAKVLDDAGLDPEAEEQLAKRFAKQYHLITNDDRLDKIAADLVRHFTGRGYRGKAMFVAIDKATAVRMYDKVQMHWTAHLKQERTRVAAISDAVEREALEEQLAWLEATDMAVIVSQSQNEIEVIAKRGADIRPHRQRMVKEELDERFKAADDPLRLVFVCAMWITGFDVPTCSTIYLDKPMKNHTLMQTIARANRVAPGKQAGLIVDYVGVFRNLKDALAIYAKPRPGVETDPIKEKAQLLAELKVALDKALAFAAERGVDPDAVIAAQGFERAAKIRQAAEALLGTDEDKREFLGLVGTAWKLFKAVLPDPAVLPYRGAMVVLQVIAETMRSLTRAGPSKDLEAVLAEIERLVDQAISGIAIRAPILQGGDLKKLLDLSTIDFDKLAALFAQGSKKTATEVLRGTAEKRAKDLAAKNPARVSLLERLQKLIDEYNTGSMDIEELFQQLMAFVGDLDEEEQRHIREGLSEEELAIFDILTKPEPKLTKTQEIEVKKLARELLAKLRKDKLVLDWRIKETAKAGVRQTIGEEFDAHLPDVYDRKLFEEKVQRTYQFVFERMGASNEHVAL
ncbi:type I restriction endonuclease subunit R [Mesorhizobium sp. LNJC403B00]|uniref:type I restriction endonuclease subunit R n=1 Tax=Mesorhizobium sp. LNJC403B00 TaxID=1287280 RepID=UPI0003CE4BDD|nr:type I restriction endonuclease subunit R [Mesorhizobium sp. LNJC403B00]ESX96702.1 DEAD/DEAH box helicase [Mesorhizobium sp. LNJC403B00]